MHKYWTQLVITILIIDHFVGLISCDTNEEQFDAYTPLPEEYRNSDNNDNNDDSNNKLNSKRVRSEFVPVRGRKVSLNLDTVDNGYNNDAMNSVQLKSIINCQICPKKWISSNNHKRDSNLFMPMRGRRDEYFDSDSLPYNNGFIAERSAKKSQFNPMRGRKSMQSDSQLYENSDNEKRSEKFFGLRG